MVHPAWVAGREQGAQRSAVVGAEERSVRPALGIQDRQQVEHPSLERQGPRREYPVRQPSPARVERDHLRERAKPPEELGERGDVPHVADRRDEPMHEHERRAVAEDLIGDPESVLRPREPGGGNHLRSLCPP